MRRITFIFTAALAMGCIAGSSCMSTEQVKDKIRNVTAKVKEMKGIEDSSAANDSTYSTAQDGDGFLSGLKSKKPSRSDTAKKAMDKENAWYMRDFRMELSIKLANGTAHDIIQKSGDVFYRRRQAGNNVVEGLYLIRENECDIYQISTVTKQAQFQRTVEGDFGKAFRDTYARDNGLLVEETKSHESSDIGMMATETTEKRSVENETWNGFNCEKTTTIIETKSQVNPAMQALDGLLGMEISKSLDQVAKQVGNTKQIVTVWVDKASGAVVKKDVRIEGSEAVSQMSQMSTFLPSVKSLVFNPDPSLIPSSLKDYTLIN